VELLLGTQGWDYGAWVGPFYPRGSKPGEMLAVYGRAFQTVEVVSTAYGLPPDPAIQKWSRDTPSHFRFALRLPQAITHERRFTDSDKLVRRFLDRVSPLEDRLGPILIQMSPAFRAAGGNQTVLEKFLHELPSGFHWAVEFRDPGWTTPAVGEMLRRLNVATVLADGRWIRREQMMELAIEPTADFAYVRWLGTGKRLADFSFVQLEREREIEAWAGTVRTLGTRVGRVYGYFSNHFQGHAPQSARKLQQLLGQDPVSPGALREQAELF
jgi:uncharacterized protein YecE (DUF72 family)